MDIQLFWQSLLKIFFLTIKWNKHRWVKSKLMIYMYIYVFVDLLFYFIEQFVLI